MKKILVSFASSIAIFSLAYSQSLVPTELNIYSDSAYLISEYITTVKGWKDIPINIPKNSLVFLEPLSCNLEYIEDRKLTSLDEYKVLKEDIKTLEAQILALKSILKLSNNINFEKNTRYINSIKALETFFEKKYLEYIELKNKLEGKKKVLKYLKNSIQPTTISVFCPSIETVKVKTRSPIDAKTDVFYYIFGNSEKDKVYIENRVKIRVDRDIKNIKINIFQYPTQKRYFYEGIRYIRAAAPPMSKRVSRSYTEKASVFFYSINNVSLKRNLTKNILISKKNLPAKFEIEVNGHLGSIPYLIATIKPDRMYPPAKAYFYIDGIFLKTDYINTLQRGENNRVLFGEDKLFKVRKEKVKDITVKFSKTHVKRYVKWRYTFKNKHNKKMKVLLIDYIPVSYSYKRKIEPVSSLMWRKYNKVTGKLEWEFYIQPNKTYILEYGYKELKPIEKKKDED
ncbi:MAG: hypothetical protein DSY66_00675 [Persephonella sp.]|nr:MAG: hypothetical protein DSY66_00675 [Persephonella sp.]